MENEHHHLEKAPKAYDNKSFIHSKDGRMMRIMAEYLHPLSHFKRNFIHSSIIFFGSARIPSKELLEKHTEDLLELLAEANTDTAYAEVEERLKEHKAKEPIVRYYDDAVELAKLITEWSNKLPKKYRYGICTGGGPGIMEAANRGAQMAGGRSIGLNISLPFEQYPNNFIDEDLNFEFHYFFMRKFWFVYLAEALIAFPGGFGTLDELMEILTLLQTRKVTREIPVLLYGEEFWKKLINFDYLIEMGLISKKDLNLFKFVNTPEEAFTYIRDTLTSYLKLPKVD
jgi:uncharacterized protein (TIGR00730 family)